MMICHVHSLLLSQALCCPHVTIISQVFAVDSVPARLALAQELGATPVDFSSCDAAAAVREATQGRGVDVALEVS